MTKIKYVAEVKFVIVDNHNMKKYHKYDQLFMTEDLNKLVEFAEAKLGISLSKKKEKSEV